MISQRLGTFGGIVATDTLFPTTVVARVFRVDPQSIANWKTEDRLVPDKINDLGHFFFGTATLDAFLRGAAFGFKDDSPPTFMELYRGQDRLLKRDEVADQCGVLPSTIGWRVSVGNMPVLRLARRALRFPAALVARIASAEADTLTARQAGQILGVAAETVLEVVHTGQLVRAEVSDPHSAFHITRASFLTYLADRLAESGMPPLVWWQDRLVHPEPLVTPAQIKRRLRYDWENVDDLLSNGRLTFIRTPNNFRLVPARQVAALEEWRLPLTAQAIAQLFSTSEATAQFWIDTRALCQESHDRSNLFCPRKACVLEYIRRHAHPDIRPEDWWHNWSSGADVPFSTTTTVDLIVGSDARVIHDAVDRGTLRGIPLPPNEHGVAEMSLLSQDVRVLRRLYERELSGGEYWRSTEDTAF